MYPEMHLALPFGLHVTLASHAVVTLLGVFAATMLVARQPGGAALAWIAPVAALGVLGGSRAFYWLFDGGPWLRAGGLASMGGVAAGLASAPVLAWVARVPVRILLDVLVPAALLALGIGRIGCLLAGCCAGSATTLPWGVVFPALGAEPRHPLQAYSALADLAIVWLVRRRPLPPGQTAARTLAAFAAVRIALEALRDPAATETLGTSGPTVAQISCLVLLLGVRPWLVRPDGRLWRPGARGSVPKSMRPPALILALALLGAAAPAAALDAEFVGTLAVRPARGKIDLATGQGALAVRGWRLMPGAGSDGIDPANEPIDLMLGTDAVTLPAGAVTASASARRYFFRDDGVTRGLTRLRMKRRSDGTWQVSFAVRGIDLTLLVTQYPRCEPLALVVGNDAAASGVDIDRPRGVESRRLKVRGFCQIEGCPFGPPATTSRIRPRHVICPF